LSKFLKTQKNNAKLPTSVGRSTKTSNNLAASIDKVFSTKNKSQVSHLKINNLKNSPTHQFPTNEVLAELLDLYKKQRFRKLNYRSRQLLKIFKDSYIIWNLLGISLQTQGQITEATAAFKKVVTLNPQFPDGLNNLGNNLNKLQEYDGAIKYLQKAVELKPDFHVALNNLGNALKGARRFEEAIQQYDLAISYKPNYSEAIYNKGLVLRKLGQIDLALTTLEHAVISNKQFTEAFNSIGSIYNDKQNTNKALEYFYKAIAVDPKSITAYLNLCEVYEKTNEVGKFSDVLSLASKNKVETGADFIFYKGLLAFRQKKYSDCISLLDKVEVHQLLGRREASYWRIKANSHQNLGEYNNAFSAFVSMNAFMKNSEEFDEIGVEQFYKRVEAKVTELKSLSAPPHFKHLQQTTLKYKLYFLIGFPRSGTTLIDTIMRSHSKLCVVEEKPMINLADIFLDRPKISEIERLNDQDITAARCIYLKELEKHISNKDCEVVIDKLPLNIIQLPIIQRLFPDARYLFALRHPLDSILSCWMQNFQLNSAMGNFLDLTRTVDFYCRTMEIAELCIKRYSLETSRIYYENLVENMQDEIKKLLEFIGLQWEENLKNYQQTAKERAFISTPSYSQVIEPLYKSASYRWKNYESQLKSEIYKIDPWITQFGYST